MKKILAIVLCIVFAFSIPVSAKGNEKKDAGNDSNLKEMTPELMELIEENQKYVDDYDSEGSDIIVVNEIEMMSSLSHSSDEELLELGYSKDEIKEIRSFDFVKEINKLDKLSDKELKKRGYTDKKIKKIREFDGTMISASEIVGDMTITYRLHAFSYSSGRTSFANSMRWEWNQLPLFTFHDAIASSISEGMYRHNSAYHQVWYYDMGDKNDFVEYKIYDMDSAGEPTGLMGNTFDVNLYQVGDTEHPIAMKGFAYFYWQKLDDVQQVSGYIKYGHTYISCIPTFKLTGSGLYVSVEPGWKVDDLFNKYFYEER